MDATMYNVANKQFEAEPLTRVLFQCDDCCWSYVNAQEEEVIELGEVQETDTPQKSRLLYFATYILPPS